MKKTLLNLLLLSALGAFPARADFSPIPLAPSSFNNDPVVEIGAPLPINASVTASVDAGTNKNGATLYERGYNLTNPTTGIPVAGSLATNVAGDHIFLMPPDYHVNCAIMVGKNDGGGSPII